MDKLNLLYKSKQKLFHTQDLALLWGVENRNTLYTTIKRYVKRGILTQVIKGLYSKVSLDEIDQYTVGSALIHKFCYVSCETVLAKEGVISQQVLPITFVSSVSIKIKLGDNLFVYRKAKPEILLNPDGVVEKEGYFMATKERAISDMLYFNPKYYFDNKDETN